MKKKYRWTNLIRRTIKRRGEITKTCIRRFHLVFVASSYFRPRMQSFTFLVSLFILGIVCVALIDRSQGTPLDDYVRAPDPHFNWTVIHQYNEPDYTLFILNFTSQKWFDGRAIECRLNLIEFFFRYY